MDFDEYEYLEKTVENPDLAKEDSSMRNGVASEEKGQQKTSSKSRTNNADRDSERPSKRVKSEEERDRHRDRDRDKDREKDRGSSRHRSYADRDGERGEKERRRSSREERNGKDRERERDRGKDRDRDRDKEKDKEKEREKEKIKELDREMEQELERERERSRRSRSRSERHRDEERDKHMERSRDKEFREREGRSASANLLMVILAIEPYKELRRVLVRGILHKKEEAGEPEADPERDQRTVFAYQINLKADERDVYEFFSRAGKVRDVRLIMDRNSRRSKGVGYIEFYDAMSVPMAIALTGQKLLGQAVMVKPSEAEKNLVQSTSTAAGGAGASGAQSGGARKLYVGNLHFNINEEQLRAVFESFGTVELVQLPLDPETGHCKGFGFVQFARLEDARAAQSINGQLEIAGRTIKVSAVTDQVGMQDAGATTKDLDDDEGGGLTLNAHSRALLMQKLDRSGTATGVSNTLTAAVNNPAPATSVLGFPPAAVNSLIQPPFPALTGFPAGLPVGAATIPPVDSIGIPSECLLLKNMFDPNVETEPDFDLDIKEDVQDECSKYGKVKHIFVDKNTAGFVYLHFDNATSASSAQRALHGRWFAGKMITATFMIPSDYEAKFPSSS